MSAAKAATSAQPVSVGEAKDLFANLVSEPAIVLAVSGGPDSTALLFLAARWRKARRHGPKLLAVTVDHRLRAGSATEAKQVARLARSLGVSHRILRWTGAKPKSGLQEKARIARYRLLSEAAVKTGASHILTAHTLDDQAETVLMRLLRGSGPTGLSGMARVSSASPSRGEGRGEGGLSLTASHRRNPLTRRASRGDLSPRGRGERKQARQSNITLLRPLLEIPKARLLATLRAAKIPFIDDPSNLDPRFARVRLRGLMPTLVEEGLDAKRLAVLARRLRRAEAALEATVEEAAKLAQGNWASGGRIEMAAQHFAALPAEVALRLLGRAVTMAGNEGPVELAKLEALHAAITAKKPKDGRFRRTLAGAMVTVTPEGLTVERAPPRRMP